MPPQIQQLLQNQRMLAIAGGGAVLLIIIIIVAATMMGGGHKEGESRKLKENERALATVDSPGKAIEIQAMLAREKIESNRVDVEGGKVNVTLGEEATLDERDRAVVTLVQSGLMDKNVGLEVFDKGDLTASREEKRIKLVRARNGELARLIRKIQPIQDATVFISMPEPTIFVSDMEPVSATVQVTLSPGEQLSRDKVRSIINLLVGSIENLQAKHVSLTDTNGNVYNSVLDATDELMDKLEERDRYMEQKVKTQLDRLIGPGKYVATVATYLREASKNQMSLDYEPQESAVAKSSAFQENLNSSQKTGGAGGAVSSYIPPGVDTTVDAGDQSHRGYNRNGQEIEYNSGKRQTTEDFTPGMMEEITIAVTVDGGAFPPGMSQDEFRTLVARSASPMVKPESVTIANGRIETPKPITPSTTTNNSSIFSFSSIPWWIWAGVGGVLFIAFLLVLNAMNKPSMKPELLQQQQREIEQLRELASTQAQQIQNTQQQAQQLMAQQQQMAQIAAQQQQQQQPQAQPAGHAALTDSAGAQELKQTLNELQAAMSGGPTGAYYEDEDDEDDLGMEMKSWIESR